MILPFKRPTEWLLLGIFLGFVLGAVVFSAVVSVRPSLIVPADCFCFPKNNGVSWRIGL